jgi:transposase
MNSLDKQLTKITLELYDNYKTFKNHIETQLNYLIEDEFNINYHHSWYYELILETDSNLEKTIESLIECEYEEWDINEPELKQLEKDIRLILDNEFLKYLPMNLQDQLNLF